MSNVRNLDKKLGFFKVLSERLAEGGREGWLGRKGKERKGNIEMVKGFKKEIKMRFR